MTFLARLRTLPSLSRIYLLSFLLVVGGAHLLLFPGIVTHAGNDQEGSSDLMAQAMQLVSQARSTPVTEPGIPVQQVTGNWKMTLLKLTDKVVIFTAELPPTYKFYIQTSICKQKDKPATFFDGTLLGEHETAATFYEANYSFYSSDDLDYLECVGVGVNLRSTVNPATTDHKHVLTHSDERVLQHMSNWLLFLATVKKDGSRSADFLPFTLNRYRMVLLAANEDHDQKEVVSEIKFFDHTFPFEVFDLNLPLSVDGRGQVREFFRTIVFLRNRLKALSPDAASQIARDEALLKKFQ